MGTIYISTSFMAPPAIEILDEKSPQKDQVEAYRKNAAVRCVGELICKLPAETQRAIAPSAAEEAAAKERHQAEISNLGLE
jgi:hypothetical protein